jgi:hypothetical protein
MFHVEKRTPERFHVLSTEEKKRKDSEDAKRTVKFIRMSKGNGYG